MRMTVRREYGTFNYFRYNGSENGKEVVLYLPRTIVNAPDEFEILVTQRTPAPVPGNRAEHFRHMEARLEQYRQNMEALGRNQVIQLAALNKKFEQLIESVRVAPNNPANAKPKRKYTRRKTAKRSVKRAR